MKRSLFFFSLLFAFFICFAPSFLHSQDDGGLIPNGGFEDSNEVFGFWHQSYGKSFFEDSISLKGELSLGLKEQEEEHIDLSSEDIQPTGSGTYQLSFWYRAREGYTEGAPFWVEVMQGGESLQVFRPGSKEAENRNLARDWILFAGDVEVSGSAPLRVHIHSDLPRLWLDDISFGPKAY